MLKHRTSESDVIEALSDICNPELYMTYEFPPPEMRQGCQIFIGEWDELVEREFMAREGNAKIEDRICLELTKACYNVNVKDAPQRDKEVFVDG